MEEATGQVMTSKRRKRKRSNKEEAKTIPPLINLEDGDDPHSKKVEI